jgi:enoyl-CoA hydratase/carnithine racemase
MNARAAESAGLVARVVPDDEVVDTAVASAEKISTFSSPVVMMAKEAVQAGGPFLRLYETRPHTCIRHLQLTRCLLARGFGEHSAL